jgi:hypothetical protein
MMTKGTTYDTDVVMDDGTVIRTTVTSSGDAVEAFLREVVGKQGRHLLVGIDTEWRVVPTENGRPKNHMPSCSSALVGAASSSGSSTPTTSPAP